MIRNVLTIAIAVFLNIVITKQLLIEKPQKIVVIDNEAIFREMVLKITSALENKDEEEIEQKVEEYDVVFDQFRKELSEIALENNLVILYKNNVFGGAIDQTEQAQTILDNIMSKDHATKK